SRATELDDQNGRRQAGERWLSELSGRQSEAGMSEAFDLSMDEQGKLTLRMAGGDEVKDVRVRRAFPWSRPNQFVSIRSSEGKELLLIKDPSSLPPQVRR